MELLEGETLGARIAHGPMPVRKAVDIAAQIAGGLAAAHDKQIAHRDLKPENVFLTPTGGVKILDFGLARSTDDQSELTGVESPIMAPATTPGTVLGTVGYMSPEQVRGEPTDHRTDVFSLGCVLYEMLTGQRAYRRDTAAETMSAILRDDPPDPGTLNVNVPPAVLRTLRRCLEKRPQERFESARELAFALKSSVDSSSTSAATALTPLRDRRWLGAATVALVLGTIIGVAGARLMRIGSSAALDSAGAQFRQLTFDRGTIRDGRFTPDGQSIIYGAAWNGQPLKIYSNDGAAPAPIPELAAGEVPVQWTPDGRGLIVAHGEGLPWVVERLDLSTGTRTPATTIRAHDPAGLRQSMPAISRDAKYYVHSYSRLLSDLLVVNGLK